MKAVVNLRQESSTRVGPFFGILASIYGPGPAGPAPGQCGPGPWSWTIDNLEEYSKVKYAPGSYLKCKLLQ